MAEIREEEHDGSRFQQRNLKPTILIMNTLELDPSNRLPIRIEAAPAFGQGSMPADAEKTFVLLAHLSRSSSGP